MKEIVILSGKGGAGKTSLAAAFASLEDQIVVADCDVDAADMHLLLETSDQQEEDFYSGYEPIMPDNCSVCGDCARLCKFDAIEMHEDKPVLIAYACEGCGVCADHCPDDAIKLKEAHTGLLFEGRVENGPMVHARLNPGGENSGKLVAAVRQKARQLGTELGIELMLTDGPPGIGCPVISTLGGASAVMIIVEPTVSGIHDMERVLRLCHHFDLPAYLCINKADLNPQKTEMIAGFAASIGVEVIGRVPLSSDFNQAQLQAIPVTKLAKTDLKPLISSIWNRFREVAEI